MIFSAMFLILFHWHLKNNCWRQFNGFFFKLKTILNRLGTKKGVTLNFFLIVCTRTNSSLHGTHNSFNSNILLIARGSRRPFQASQHCHLCSLFYITLIYWISSEVNQLAGVEFLDVIIFTFSTNLILLQNSHAFTVTITISMNLSCIIL